MTPFAEHHTLDLVGIGNAIVDVLARVEPDFLARWNMQSGTMALIDAARAAALSDSLEAEARGAIEMIGGGSVANTCVVAARLGARVAYLGKVDSDAFGAAFVADLAASGVACPVAPLDAGDASAARGTGRCVIAVTPDGQRTMNTYLGAATSFGPHDLDRDVIGRARFLYLEGYLFDPPAAQDAFRSAAALAHEAGRKVALSLSDAFCVGRHRTAFRALAAGHVDILFANEDEIVSLYEAEDFETAAVRASRDVGLAVLTRGERGSVVFCRGERTDVAAVPAVVRDSTGAGDAYAAGFLFGLVRGLPIGECGRIGSVAASEVISHFGARPEQDLRALAGI